MSKIKFESLIRDIRHIIMGIVTLGSILAAVINILKLLSKETAFCLTILIGGIWIVGSIYYYRESKEPKEERKEQKRKINIALAGALSIIWLVLLVDKCPFVFSKTEFKGEIKECKEGTKVWVEYKNKVYETSTDSLRKFKFCIPTKTNRVYFGSCNIPCSISVNIPTTKKAGRTIKLESNKECCCD